MSSVRAVLSGNKNVPKFSWPPAANNQSSAAEREDEDLAAAISASQADYVKASFASAKQAEAALESHSQAGALPSGQTGLAKSLLKAAEIASADGDLANAELATLEAQILLRELQGLANRLQQRAQLAVQQQLIEKRWAELQEHSHFKDLPGGEVGLLASLVKSGELALAEDQPTEDDIENAVDAIRFAMSTLATLSEGAGRLQLDEVQIAWQDVQALSGYASLQASDIEKVEASLVKATEALKDLQSDEKAIPLAMDAVVQAAKQVEALRKKVVVLGRLTDSDEKVVALGTANITRAKVDGPIFKRSLEKIEKAMKEVQAYLDQGKLEDASSKSKVIVEMVESCQANSQFYDDVNDAYRMAEAVIKSLDGNDPVKRTMEERLKKAMGDLKAAALEPPLRIAATQRLRTVANLSPVYTAANDKRATWGSFKFEYFKANRYADVDSWIRESVVLAEEGDIVSALAKLDQLDILFQIPERADSVFGFAQTQFTGTHPRDLQAARQAIDAALALAVTGDFNGAKVAIELADKEVQDTYEYNRGQSQFPRLKASFEKAADATLAAITNFEGKWGNATDLPAGLRDAKKALKDFRDNLTYQTYRDARIANDEANSKLREVEPLLDLSRELAVIVAQLPARGVTAGEHNQFQQRLNNAKASLANGDLAVKGVLQALKTEFERKNADCLARIENNANTHLAARHGADVTQEQLKIRLTTGVTPDGAVAPNQCCSKFLSYNEMTSTLADALAVHRLTLDEINRPLPTPTDKKALLVTMDHGRVIGEGYRGVTAAGKVRCVYADGTPQDNVDGTPKTQDVYAIAFLEKFQKTFTRIEWKSNRWKVTQHFPTA